MRRRRILQGQGGQQADRILAAKRAFAGEHLIEDATEAEKIGAGVHGFALGLLRGHVRRRAEHGPRLRQPDVVVLRPGQAEVEKLDTRGEGEGSDGDSSFSSLVLASVVPCFEPDVAGLDVAVDEAGGVGGGQALGHLGGDAQGLGQGQLAFAFQAGVERFALEQRHGQVGDAVVLADLVDGDDVVVLDAGGGAGFAQEAFAVLGVGGEGGSMVFRATLRCSSVSSARKTTPMPPAPSFLRTR